MKKIFKLMSLPIALTCMSVKLNSPLVQFVAFSICDEKPEQDTFRLVAYIDILYTSKDKTIYYEYNWIDATGEPHFCGCSMIVSVKEKKNAKLAVSNEINVTELKEYSPIKFTCTTSITNEDKHVIEMDYNTKTIDEFTISESYNNKELSTGYIKESTFIDPSLDYHYEDTITFLNFEDLRVNDIYYDIDLSYLRFKYRNGLDNILKGDFKFAFYDRYNLFPDFPIGESMYRYIPLKFNVNQDECYFTFDVPLFYDPNTHDCSTIQKEGYLSTSNLMLPFNSAAELKFLPCYIELNVHSHTNFKITGKFMMTYLKKYFGDCEDSEFCNEIHQDEEVNIREKVIEVEI